MLDETFRRNRAKSWVAAKACCRELKYTATGEGDVAPVLLVAEEEDTVECFFLVVWNDEEEVATAFLLVQSCCDSLLAKPRVTRRTAACSWRG